MSYSVNWTTKVITVPLADLTLISGSNYSLDTGDFWIEMRRLEASAGDGLWAAQAVEYVNTQLLSGITYSAIVKLINSYTWDTDTTDKNIFLIGFNSNLLDAFIPGDGMSVLANNSAGMIVGSSSGLTTSQDEKLADLHKAHFHRRYWDKTAKTITLYEADKTTPFYVFDTNDDMSEIIPIAPSNVISGTDNVVSGTDNVVSG